MINGFNISLTIRVLLLCALTFIVISVLSITLLVTSNFVSPEVLTRSIKRDVQEFTQDGDRPNVIGTESKYRLDRFTDSIMLMQSIPDRNMTAFENAIMAPFFDYIPEEGRVSPTVSLQKFLEDESIENNNFYILYWHGYRVPLRALLPFLSPLQIITLNSALLLLLGLAVMEVFRRVGGWAMAIAFVIALLATFSWIAPLSFQYFTCYLLAFIATLVLYWMLKTKRGYTWIMPLFLAVGMLTSFFDFLTTPLLTFLLPMTLLLVWNIKQGNKGLYSDMVFAGAAWLFGYAVFWALKWALTAFAHCSELANDLFVGQITGRGGSDGYGIEYRLEAVLNNIYFLGINPESRADLTTFIPAVMIVAACIFLSWLLLFFLTGRNVSKLKTALPLLLICAGPYLWYFVLANHSLIHRWFTYRLQIASIFALLLFFILSLDWNHIYKKLISNSRDIE